MRDECSKVHELARKLKRRRFPFEETEIPLNGIYILFEEGEHGHGGNRIVRVGTHTGDNNLRKRLKQHFSGKNKNSSIFRKNIGRAILNRENDPFLCDWEIKNTADKIKKNHTENQVNQRIQSSFSFCAFEIHGKEERLALESAIISTISRCNQCGPSPNWLGKNSPKEKIVQSGLWLVNGLYKTPLDTTGIEWLSWAIRQSSPARTSARPGGER